MRDQAFADQHNESIMTFQYEIPDPNNPARKARVSCATGGRLGMTVTFGALGLYTVMRVESFRPGSGDMIKELGEIKEACHKRPNERRKQGRGPAIWEKCLHDNFLAVFPQQ